MKHLTQLFHLLELTRNQPQTGYVIWGGQTRMGNLAEHHYLVLMIAWQIAVLLRDAGAHIDLEKVFEFAAVHDVGELFGGDISMPYARVNPQAKEYAKVFEVENQRFIAGFFGSFSKRFGALSDEIMDAQSDEARIVKVADYLEVTHYKFFIGRFVQSDIDLVTNKIKRMVAGMADPIARIALKKFVINWNAEMRELVSYPDTIVDILESQK